jgi:hypothetical protein
MAFLLLSLAALALGPIVYGLAARRPAGLGVLDSFLFVTLSGLVLLHLIPHALHVGGGAAATAALLGLGGPALAERMLHRAAAGVHLLVLSAALLGLGGHAFFDGLALIGSQSSAPLAIAVILHRLPDGLAIWWLLRPPYGAGVAASTLGLMATATACGFFVGDVILFKTNQAWLASLQAFVSASLVHVVLHRPQTASTPPVSEGDVAPQRRRAGLPDLLGGLLGGGLLAALLLDRHEGHDPILLTGAGLGVFLLACLVRYGPWAWTEKLIGHHEHPGKGASQEHDHPPPP